MSGVERIEPFSHPLSDLQEDPAAEYGVHDPVSICESKYPETTKAFKDIQKDQYTLFCMKQLDYGPENITLGKDTEISENRKLSLLGIWFRSNDKIQRILNLIQNDRNPQNESLEDSWTDLSNYSIISMLVSRNKWGK